MGAPAIAVSVELVVLECGSCGMTFGVPPSFGRRCREEGLAWRCPSPACAWPSQVFTSTRAARLEAELSEAKRRADSARLARQWAEERAEAERRSRIAHQGHATRLRRRAAAGLCPCCRETFPDLARHVAQAHPDLAGAAEDGSEVDLG